MRLRAAHAFIKPQRPIEGSLVFDGEAAAISGIDEASENWGEVHLSGAEFAELPLVVAFQVHVHDETPEDSDGVETRDAAMLEIDGVEDETHVRPRDACDHVEAHVRPRRSGVVIFEHKEHVRMPVGDLTDVRDRGVARGRVVALDAEPAEEEAERPGVQPPGQAHLLLDRCERLADRRRGVEEVAPSSGHDDRTLVIRPEGPADVLDRDAAFDDVIEVCSQVSEAL